MAKTACRFEPKKIENRRRIIIKKPELLAPAGDLEKLKTAAHFGADAVYVGGLKFGLRARAKNFNPDELEEGVAYAKKRGVKVYVAANVFARDDDFYDMTEYFKTLREIGVNAVIASDPAVISLALEMGIDVHVSVQANVTNWRSALFWRNIGAKRVVAARELSFADIRNMRVHLPPSLEIEAFAHGAMCVAYSGRCFLSSYMTGRDANAGNCSHACRWEYAVVEKSRPLEKMPIEEDERGAYVMSSKDLCLIRRVPELIRAGVSSLKIEGRVKSPHYVATTVAAYRRAIDDYFTDAAVYERNKDIYMNELMKIADRGFTDGFAVKTPSRQDYAYEKRDRAYAFLGVVQSYDERAKTVVIEQRGKFCIGDKVEFLRANGSVVTHTLTEMSDDEGTPIESAPRAKQLARFKLDEKLSRYDILRKRL
ncbi:MAG: U32 family peptidase [Clostridiales bacterium]|nr:U32 family peptidase [Clostridiales bacterium]